MGNRDRPHPLDIPTLSDWKIEATVLSLLLNREDLQPSLLVELREEDFDHPTYRWLFKYVRDEFKAGRRVGYYEAVHALTKAGHANQDVPLGEQSLGLESLRLLHTEVFDDGKAVLSWLKAFSAARQLQEAARTVLLRLRVGRDGSPPNAQGAAEYLMKVATKAVAPAAASKVFAPAEWLERTVAYVETRRSQKPEDWVLPLGLGELDKLLAVEAGDLVVIAGPSGKGKTALATHMATEMGVYRGIETLYGNTELKLEKFGVRFLAKVSGRDAFKIRSGNLNVVDLAAIEEAKEKIRNSRLFLTDALTDVDLHGTVALVRQYHMQHGIKVFIWDHMLRAVSGGEREWQDLTEAAKTMKQLAQELGIVVIMLTQLTDDGFLAGSRRMKQEMDILMFLQPWFPDPADETLTPYEREMLEKGCNAWLIVDKGRDTPADGKRFPLWRNLATMDHVVLDVGEAIGNDTKAGKKSSKRK